MFGFLVACGLVFAVAIGYALWATITTSRGQEAALAAVAGDFTPEVRSGGIAIDNGRRLLCMLTGDPIVARLYSPADVLSVEVVENGHSVTKTSRSSQMGGALVGGLVLGPVGALMGGLSGKQTTKSKVDSYELRVAVVDSAVPVITIAFGPDGTDARNWHARVASLIRLADQAVASRPTSHSSLADELAKLAALRESGVLSAVEFEAQKMRLLT